MIHYACRIVPSERCGYLLEKSLVIFATFKRYFNMYDEDKCNGNVFCNVNLANSDMY